MIMAFYVTRTYVFIIYIRFICQCVHPSIRLSVTSTLGPAFWAMEQVRHNEDSSVESTWLATDYRCDRRLGRHARLEWDRAWHLHTCMSTCRWRPSQSEEGRSALVALRVDQNCVCDFFWSKTLTIAAVAKLTRFLADWSMAKQDVIVTVQVSWWGEWPFPTSVPKRGACAMWYLPNATLFKIKRSGGERSEPHSFYIGMAVSTTYANTKQILFNSWNWIWECLWWCTYTNRDLLFTSFQATFRSCVTSPMLERPALLYLQAMSVKVHQDSEWTNSQEASF